MTRRLRRASNTADSAGHRGVMARRVYRRHGMRPDRFDALVRRALEELPPAFAERLENVAIVVRSRPTAGQSRHMSPRGLLLGLYVGMDQTRRDGGYNFALPDRIFIFQEALEQIAHGEKDLLEQVRHTVIHELAHHFGISDARLRELDSY